MIRRSLFLAWLSVTRIAVVSAGELPPAQDLRADAARAAGQGAVLVVLFSRQDCPYCQRVRAGHLLPLSKDIQAQRRVLLRELDIEGGTALIDFSGRSTTAREYARSQGIRLVPVVRFYDGKGGEAAPEIVGALLDDFYAAYLEQAIATAQTRIAHNKSAQGELRP